MRRLRDREYREIVNRIFAIMQEYRCIRREHIQCQTTESTELDRQYYIYRSDTNAVLARSIHGFDAAKAKARDLRKRLGINWDLVKIKMERSTQSPKQDTGSRRLRFGLSPDGRTFRNASGQTGVVDYSPRYNPSKRGRFRGYTDLQGNYHDID